MTTLQEYSAIIIGASTAYLLHLSRILVYTGCRTALHRTRACGETCVNVDCTAAITIVTSSRMA